MSLDKYLIRLESPTTEAFFQLRSQIGWGGIDKNLAETSLKNSVFHVTIYDKNQLIAMGRVVGDGAMYFYIQDVIVAPDYQKMGLGSALMEKIEHYLSVTAKPGSTIGLLAAKGKEAFYSQYGYTNRPNDILGNGMCRFV